MHDILVSSNDRKARSALMWRNRELLSSDMLGRSTTNGHITMSSEFPQDFKSSPTMGTKSHSSSPPPLPHRQTNGDHSPPTSASILESNLNKKSSSLLQSKVNSSSLASVSSSSSSAFSSSASQMVKSSASRESSSLLSKKSQMISSLASSREELKAAENRNYSRSMSLTSSSTDRMKMLSHNRGFSMEEVLAEEDSPSQQNGGSSSPIISTPMSPKEGGGGGPISPQELRFEQKRVASSSHCKVQTNDYTAEKSASTNKELKRVQAGDVSYEEKRANSATKARLDSDGFSAEKLSSTLQEQKRLVNSEGIAQQNRKAAHTAVKMSTDEYTAEKVATSKQEERQLFTQGSLHQERNVQTSSKMAFSTKAMSSSVSSVSKSSSNQLEFNNFSSLMNSGDFSLTGTSQRLAITRGFEEDLELLSTGNASAQDVHRITQRITQRMEMCVQKLKTATDDEAEAILGSINDIVRKAWAVPTVGYDLGFNVCNILRNSGGLDILVGHLKSGNDSLEFHSAQVLEQCLSTENRSYIVENGLEKVVSVACSCSTRNSLPHSRIGTGILAHLFKHSEVTCSDVIRMGGLKAILYDCRTSDVETLRHCATALANLSLYGGPENQQAMIINKAPVWLFPLAFHPDDNIKYYACLAIAALVANKEIEAAVLRSGTLDLVEPFVSSHNPEEFATSSVQHVHGQSKNWLLRLVPVLNSKREEARSLAAFHFAMEAGIKKKQGNTSIFNEIGAVDALKKVASSPNAIASKYAAQALLLIGEEVPHKLSQQVPLWTVEDVREWVKQIGFAHYSQQFMNSRVDGDLLLQLTEEMLKEDIGIKNGILRRRFLRELSQLKRLADYSSCDNTNLNHMMQNLGPDFCQYTYPMLQCGVDRNTLKFLSETQLERECGIENSIHRLRISQAILGLAQGYQEEDLDPLDINKKSLDVFVSYRRSNGSQLASLLKVHLQLRGFSVFIDVERLEAGKFDNNLLNSIQQAKYFLLVLTPNSLDRCMEDVEGKDWVRREIVEALQSQCNIIPILDNFQWPEPDMLPEDMRAVCYFNGVRWIHDYQDACVDKLERFMRGEKNVQIEGPFGRLMGSIGGCPGTPGTPSTLSKAPIYQRSASNDSTKGGSTCSDKENTNSTTTNHTKPIIEYPPN